MLDVAGGANMQQGINTYFTADRHGTPNSALNLNGGYTQVPPGVYFYSAFTITAWVYPNNVGSCARVLDFGNGESIDNVVMSLSLFSTMQIYFEIVDDSTSVFILQSSSILPLNEWSFLSLTFDGTMQIVYINGIQVGSNIISISKTPRILNMNFFGKSNYPWDGYSWSLIDELRIYNRSLPQTEINLLMCL